MELEGNYILAGSLLLASLCVLLVAPRGKPWDPFAPGRFYASTWLFVVGLCQLRLYPEEEPWRMETWLVVVAGTVSFIVGSWLFTRHSRRPVALQVRALGAGRSFPLVLVEILMLVAGGVLLLEYQVRGAIPILSDDPEFRVTFGINSYIHRIALAIVPLTSLYCILSLQAKEKSFFRRLRRILVIGVGTALIVTMESRFFLAVTYFPVIVFASYYKELPSRKVFLARFVPVVLLLLYSRAIYKSFSYIDYAERHGTSTWDSVFAPFYFSAVAHFQGLQLIMELIPNWTDFRYGLGGSLDFITAFLRGPLKLDYGNYAAFVKFNFWWNQYTYLGLSYIDFGYVGVIVVPFVVGALCGSVYRLMLRKPDTVSIYWHGMLVCGIIFSLMTNVIMTIGFVYNLVVVWMVAKVCGFGAPKRVVRYVEFERGQGRKGGFERTGVVRIKG